LKETGRETPGAISLWPKQIYIILTKRRAFFTYLHIRYDYKMAHISETTWSWKKIFSGNLIQYIYIPKMDLSQNTQKSHLAPFSQSRSQL